MDKESLRCQAYCLELVNNGRLSLRVDRKYICGFLFGYDSSEDVVRFGPEDERDKVFYYSQYLGGNHIITCHVSNECDGSIVLPGLKKELRYYEIEHVSDLDNLERRHKERLDIGQAFAEAHNAVSAYTSLVRSLSEDGF